MKYQIRKPTLIVDEKKCRRHIAKMIAKLQKHQLLFRPHFKTHQSIEIGRWFREMGIEKITVSSMEMAAYFASDGWKDITVAFPANWLEIDQMNELNQRITLNLLVESAETINFLNLHLKNPAGVFLKIDAGYHRTGILSDNTLLIAELIQKIKAADHLNLLGFLTHSGHTYHANSVKEIEDIHSSTLEILEGLKQKFQTENMPLIVSVGDTPAASAMDSFNGADEIRPGNFIFYDLVQENLGACKYEDIAVVMACPIVAKHPERNTAVIYGGGVHLSKESLIDKQGRKIFGLIVKLNEKGWSEPIPDCYVSSLSQEHGIISAPAAFIDAIKIGELIGVLPVHSCMTANLQHAYLGLDGNIIPNHRSQ